MFPYTLVQLVEVSLFAAILIYGVLDHRPSWALLGGGLLIGKAIVNVLTPEGGTVLRRSLIGYGVAALYVAAGLVAIRLAP